MNKKIDYSKIYSPSKLSMFFDCPKSYYFSYLDPVYSRMKNKLRSQPENIWKFYTLGKAVHDAITLFYHSPPSERTEKQLKEHLKETWRSEVMWNIKPPLGKWGGFGTVEEERETYREALLMLKNFFKMAAIEPEIKYLPTDDFRHSINDYFDLITPLNQDFDISGKFDLIIKNSDDSLHIIDFKTGKESDDDFQLKFYKVLAEENFKKPVIKTSFYFLKTGSKKESDLKKGETEIIKKEILRKINQIETTDNFEPKPGGLCQFCLFKKFCENYYNKKN